jgi:hypothetical protein
VKCIQGGGRGAAAARLQRTRHCCETLCYADGDVGGVIEANASGMTMRGAVEKCNAMGNPVTDGGGRRK